MPVRPRALAAVPVILLGAALIALAGTSSAGAAGKTQAAPRPTPPNNGVTFAGLHRAAAGAACHGGYDLVGVRGACTPGPDSADEFAEAGGTKGGGGGRKNGGTVTPSPTPSPSPTSGTGAGSRCGSDGNRVQALYVHAADVPDRYATLLPSFLQWAGVADSVFANSAAETGGVRHVRFLSDASCTVQVDDVTVSATGDDDLSSTISELQSLGYNRTDRKYLIWVDANLYCGIGTIKGDDTPGQSNANNVGPSYGRTDSGCWGGYTEAHELMHNLGGVQLSAPHSSGGWHCTDEYDRMCYRDSSSITMTYPCAAAGENLFDCNHDDYFSTAPDPTSYLGLHWDAASSSFLSSS
jgi:hypothetical protein